jgi:hypothetical protein
VSRHIHYWRISEATLEWDGENLYRIRGKRREFIGTIVRNTPLAPKNGWTVWLRGESAGTFATIDEAKAFLERIA